MLSYFKWRHDTNEMVKYRNRNFKNLEAMINIHNIIVEQPNEVRLSVMLFSIERMNKQIEFYQSEIDKIDNILNEFVGNEERLNKYGKHLMNNYKAIKEELKDIIDILYGLINDIDEQIKLK